MMMHLSRQVQRGVARAVVARGLHQSRPALLAKPAADAPVEPTGANMILNFSSPSAGIYKNKEVASVIIPGLAGEYGVTKNHSPIISELKAGLVQIFHEGTPAPEKYFISGGFALTHANSITDIAAVEVVKLDDVDPDALPKLYSEAQKNLGAAAEGSKAKAEAQIEVEVVKSLASAVGVSLS